MNPVPFSITERELVAELVTGVERSLAVLDVGDDLVLEKLQHQEVAASVDAQQ